MRGSPDNRSSSSFCCRWTIVRNSLSWARGTSYLGSSWFISGVKALRILIRNVYKAARYVFMFAKIACKKLLRTQLCWLICSRTYRYCTQFRMWCIFCRRAFNWLSAVQVPNYGFVFISFRTGHIKFLFELYSGLLHVIGQVLKVVHCSFYIFLITCSSLITSAKDRFYEAKQFITSANSIF